MSNPSDEIALETLDALESRLQRVEWFLSRSDKAKESLHQVAARGRDQTVQGRLAGLESNLGKLSLKSQVVRDILKLCETTFSVVRLWLLILKNRCKIP